jgi:hypothetical protein
MILQAWQYHHVSREPYVYSKVLKKKCMSWIDNSQHNRTNLSNIKAILHSYYSRPSDTLDDTTVLYRSPKTLTVKQLNKIEVWKVLDNGPSSAIWHAGKPLAAEAADGSYVDLSTYLLIREPFRRGRRCFEASTRFGLHWHTAAKISAAEANEAAHENAQRHRQLSVTVVNG